MPPFDDIGFLLMDIAKMCNVDAARIVTGDAIATADAPASIMRAISSPLCAPLMPISDLSLPSAARVLASQWQVIGKFQKPPTPRLVPSIGANVSTSGMNPSRRPAITTESAPASNAARARSGTRSLWPVSLIQSGSLIARRMVDTITPTRAGSNSVVTLPLVVTLA